MTRAMTYSHVPSCVCEHCLARAFSAIMSAGTTVDKVAARMAKPVLVRLVLSVIHSAQVNIKKATEQTERAVKIAEDVTEASNRTTAALARERDARYTAEADTRRARALNEDLIRDLAAARARIEDMERSRPTESVAVDPVPESRFARLELE